MHLNDEQLAEIKHAPDTVADNLLDHIVSCHQCRYRLAQIDQFFSLPSMVANEQMAETFLPIKMDNGLYQWPAEKAQQSLLLRQLATDMEIGMEIGMEAEAAQTPPLELRNKSADKAEVSVLFKIKGLFAQPLPAWSALAATIAFVAVFLAIQPAQTPDEQWAIYQDPRGIQVQPAQTGIGFFGQAGARFESTGQVSVKIADNQEVLLDWPAYTGVSEYNVSIFKTIDGQRTLQLSRQAKTNHILLPAKEFALPGHYEWEISAVNPANETMTLMGGFVKGQN
jgi:hypothetical protein